MAKKLFTCRRQDYHWLSVVAETEEEALEIARATDVCTSERVYTHKGDWWAQWDDPAEFAKHMAEQAKEKP